MATFDMTPPNENERREIIVGLSGQERHVLLQHGTEAAFCGVFLDNKKDGIYTCRFCGLPLFRSNAKFDSGKPVGAICHGPWTIVGSGAAGGLRMTSWPSLKTDILNAGGEWLDQEVVVHDNLVTSRKPDDLPAFNREILKMFGESRPGIR